MSPAKIPPRSADRGSMPAARRHCFRPCAFGDMTSVDFAARDLPMTASSDKIALITGGNRGLGFETARELGAAGITVVIAARTLKAAETAAASLQAMGFKADAIQLDIAKADDRQHAHDVIKQRYGRLDILINNAGVFLDGENASATAGKKTASTTSEDILRGTFETNFFDTVFLTQALLPLVKAAPAGRIVNLSSILGSLALHAQPDSPIAHAKAFAYNASKTALNAFTIHLADELRDTAIKVNSAHPGWVQTEMGGPKAALPLSEGGKTSAQLALLGPDGPTGGYFHLGKPLPW
jgi:NAD(P)-dependent dehydrogenase (short-subunit alcohol dehydrogenase family)